MIRAGFGMGYERNSLRNFDVVAGDQPGLRVVNNFRQGSYLSLQTLPLPLSPAGQPLSTVGLDDRAQSARAYDSNLRSPYVMNWNVAIQRALPGNATFEARYVGSKGTKLLRGANINEANIFETQILDAFNAARTGGTHPLLERFFGGLTVPGIGGVVGTTRTGGDYMRNLATTQAQLANNNVGAFATFLNATAVATTDPRTSIPGGWLRRAGLPENYIVGNPQFGAANLIGNFANSTWHSLQLEYQKRFSGGWTLLSNYTFQKALGEEEGDGQELLDSFRDGRNRQLEKRPLAFGIRHVLRNSGLYELPFGPGKKFLNQSSGIVSHIVGGWQIGGIYNVFAGQPINLTSGRSTFNQFSGDATPMIWAALSSGAGRVQRLPNGVSLFPDWTQVPDPDRNNLTTTANIRNLSQNFAITDASGNLLLSNPAPGQLGSLQPFFFTGPRTFRLDVNLIKNFRLAQDGRWQLQLRMDAIDATNSPQFSSDVANGFLNTDINSPNFGRITSTASGTRIVVISARLNF